MECVSEASNATSSAVGNSRSDDLGNTTGSSSTSNAEGIVVVRVLAAVLERLVSANNSLATVDPGPVTKFHALKAPSISVLNYLERIHKYASCSTECFVLALIYIDRMIQRNNFLLTELNVHRVVITGVLLAAKFFDDAYYNNAYYAKVGGVLVTEMNSLEVEFLFRINFSLHVTPDVYSKYHAELLMHAVSTPAATTLSAAHTRTDYTVQNEVGNQPDTTWKPPPPPSTDEQPIHAVAVVQPSVHITPSPRASTKVCNVPRRQSWTPCEKDVGMQPVISSQYHANASCEHVYTSYPIVYQSQAVYVDPATERPQSAYYDPAIEQNNKYDHAVLVDDYVTNANHYPASDNTKMLIQNQNHHLNPTTCYAQHPALINLVINNTNATTSVPSHHHTSYHDPNTSSITTQHRAQLIANSRRHSDICPGTAYH